MLDDMQISGDAAIVFCLVCRVYEVMNGETIRESWANAGQTIKGHLKAVGHEADVTYYRNGGERLKESNYYSLGILQRENSR